MAERARTELGSDPDTIPFLKFFLPAFLCLQVALVAFRTGSAVAILLYCPMLALGAFVASLAVIEFRDGALRYRRLWKWTPLEKGDIVSTGVAACCIGYVRLKRAVWPLGRLYLILDRNGFALLRDLNCEGNPPESIELTPVEDRNVKLSLAWAGVLAVLQSGIWRVAGPPSSRLKEAFERQPTGLPGAYFRLWNFVFWNPSLLMSIGVFIVLGLWAVSLRNKPFAWLLAMSAGGYLSNALFYWLK